MSLSKEAQRFADATPSHINDEDFPQFCAPIILEMMNEGHTNPIIAEALIDGLIEALKDFEPLPEGQREPMIKAALQGLDFQRLAWLKNKE